MSGAEADPLGGRAPLRPWQWGVIVAVPVGTGTPYKPPPIDDTHARVQEAAARPATGLAQVAAQATGLGSTKTPEELRRESELSWPNQRRQQRGREPERTAEVQAGAGDAAADPLAVALKPTRLDGVRAVREPHPEFVIPAGTKIPCNLTTALDTTAPGLITANVPAEVRGSDRPGTVVLIDRGATLFGEVQRGVVNGLDRSFVLWHILRNPDGAKVALDSPATDETGANGLDVELNQHIWRKLRAAGMITVLNGGFSLGQAALQQGNRSGNTYFFGGNIGSSAESAASRVLEHDLQIPDTGTRPQGSACMVLVARDLNFSSVYALRHVRQP